MCDINVRTARPVTLKRPRPNPVFEQWLEELLHEAKQKRCKLESQVKEALTSLSKYPLPLNSGAECRILKGFDSKLCNFIEQRLKAQDNIYTSHQQDYDSLTAADVVCVGTTQNTVPQPSNNVVDITETDLTLTKGNLVSNKIKCKNYMTKLICYSSILMALQQFNLEGKHTVSLKELSTNASKEIHLIIKRLILSKLNLVSCPEIFLPMKEYIGIGIREKNCFLTSKGNSKAQLFCNLFNAQNTDVVNNSTQTDLVMPVQRNDCPLPSNTQDLAIIEPITTVEMCAGCYDVILLIDKNETSGSTNKNDPTVAQFKKYSDLKHEYRSLKVGDFAWVARHKYNDLELVLPYIVERKRLDDLSASIKDGRFHEQKFRLRRCGLKNVIYMVESYASKKHVGLPVQTLMQALANTRVLDGFKVHMTDSLSNSARFLAMMTKRLTIEYRDKTLKGRNAEPDNNYLMTFEFFNKMSVKSKPLSVTETFIKLLLQLKGLSVEKALAITQVYRTPKSLIHAYERLDREDGEMLLANFKYGDLSRKVGPAVSKSIYQLFSSYDIRSTLGNVELKKRADTATPRQAHPEQTEQKNNVH